MLSRPGYHEAWRELELETARRGLEVDLAEEQSRYRMDRQNHFDVTFLLNSEPLILEFVKESTEQGMSRLGKCGQPSRFNYVLVADQTKVDGRLGYYVKFLCSGLGGHD
jgi:hypothetical protein